MLAAPSARADIPQVVVASSPKARPSEGFVEAVSIQLSGRARVVKGPELAGTTSQDRIARASELASREGARLVVWVGEGDEGSASGPALHAVGPLQKGEPEFVSIDEVPPGKGPEVQRALAIKVREALEHQGARAAERADGEPSSEKEPASEKEPSSDEGSSEEETPARSGGHRSPTPPSEGAPAPIAEVALGLSGAGGNTGTQAELAAKAGLAFPLGTRGIELVAALRRPSGTDVESVSGRVTTEEFAVGLGARYLVPRGATTIGAHTAFWVRRVSAESETVSGGSGAARRHVPVVRFGPEIRWEMHPQMSLRASGMAEVSLRRQWFLIEGERVSDLGRLRLGMGLGFVASWR